MREGSNYCWAVVCKNLWFHVWQNIVTSRRFTGHRIPLGETDAMKPLPALDGRFSVQCDLCGARFLCSPSDVRRYKRELPESFTPHPLFRPGGDRRRSPRSEKGVSLIVQGESVNNEVFEENTFAASMSAHGALIALASKVQLGQTLFVKNLRTQEELVGRVVRLGIPHSGLAPVGVEFVQPASAPWPIESQLAIKSA